MTQNSNNDVKSKTLLFQDSYIHFVTHAIPWKKKLTEQPNNGTTTILPIPWILKHFTKSRMWASYKLYPCVCTHPTSKLSRLEWAIEFYMFLFIIDDMVEHKIDTSSLEDLEEFFLELMVVIISSFPKDHILKENLTKYFNDEIDHKLTKDFANKVLARVMQHSKTCMLHKWYSKGSSSLY